MPQYGRSTSEPIVDKITRLPVYVSGASGLGCGGPDPHADKEMNRNTEKAFNKALGLRCNALD
jgi:hypothetical protein